MLQRNTKDEPPRRYDLCVLFPCKRSIILARSQAHS